MRTVGAYEAKTHLSSLLDAVATGERITITRHGVPVAVLKPVDCEDKPDPGEVVDAIKAFRKEHSLGGLSLRAMIEEGRP